MRVFVDPEICRQHGQCEITVPEVFELDERGRLVYDQQPHADLMPKVEEATDFCPEQAISLIDDDLVIPDTERRVRV
jgi:ferredoxin